MDDYDKLPRFSYDLVTWLDEIVHTPSFPNTANGFYELDEDEMRRAAFTCGARSVVDMLLLLREEMEREEEEAEEATAGDISDGSSPIFPRLFNAAGEVREIASSLRVARNLPDAMLDSGD